MNDYSKHHPIIGTRAFYKWRALQSIRAAQDAQDRKDLVLLGQYHEYRKMMLISIKYAQGIKK